MKHVSILIPRGTCSISNIEGTYQILSEVNGFCTAMGQPPLFNVQLIGICEEAIQRNGLFTIKPDASIGAIQKTDLIIIPALFGKPDDVVQLNQEFIPWIINQYKAGAEIATYCVGAFFLASTGLLDGKQSATHWKMANEFRQLFPQVQLVDDKIMTEADGIYTSGGAYSYLNLLLHLIEKHAGRNMAVLTAKAFMIDINRNSQSPFIIFEGQKTHDDVQVKSVQEFIEQNFKNKITIDHLANLVAVGRRSLERRFKKATCNTLNEYIQRVKIEAAKKSLETNRKSINEVMYEVGYTDLKAFRSIFKKITGLSPLDYRNKYNKESVSPR